MALPDLSELHKYAAVPFPPGWAKDRVTLFSPVDRVHEALITVASSASHSLIVAMYGYDDDDLADVIRSTSGILQYVHEAPDREFIIGTEKGIIHRLQKENPGKVFYSPSKRLICRPMKRITMADVLSALKENRHQVTVPEEIRLRALTAVERMLAQLRSPVEHPFHVIKNLFRHKKARYRGLKKNTAQLFSLFALANLVIVKKALLATQPA